MEPSIKSQLVRFSNKHLPSSMTRFLKFPVFLKILEKILCFERIVKLRDTYSDTTNIDLIHALIKEIDLSVIYKNVEKIPSAGRLLVVANHPLAGADWMLILQCMSKVRQDIKVVINKDVNTLIVNLRDLFIPVDTYAKFDEGAREMIGKSLEKEEAVLLFPSGGISIMTLRGIRDRKWKKGVIHFSRDHQADILPVYIGGRFSRVYYLYPIRLRRLLMVRQSLHPRQHTIEVIVGDPISHKEMWSSMDFSELSSQLRERVYRLRR
jgi:putative hemolysin